MHAPTTGTPARAPGVVSTDMASGAQIGGRLRRLGRVLGGAAVVPDEPVAHRFSHVDSAYVVGKTGHLPVGDGVVAAFAPAEHRSVVDRDSTEDLRART